MFVIQNTTNYSTIYIVCLCRCFLTLNTHHEAPWYHNSSFFYAYAKGYFMLYYNTFSCIVCTTSASQPLKFSSEIFSINPSGI